MKSTQGILLAILSSLVVVSAAFVHADETATPGPLDPAESALVRKADLSATSKITDPNAIPPVGELVRNTWENAPTGKMPEWGPSVGTATVLTLDQANYVFRRLQEQPHIPFDYARDGCYARTAEMTRMMSNNGIQSVKIYVNAPQGKFLQIRKAMRKGSDQYCTINWFYHVAPAILVGEDAQFGPYIMDPSMENGPVPVSTWLSQMTAHDSTLVPILSYSSNTAYNRSPPETEFTREQMDDVEFDLSVRSKQLEQDGNCVDESNDALLKLYLGYDFSSIPGTSLLLQY